MLLTNKLVSHNISDNVNSLEPEIVLAIQVEPVNFGHLELQPHELNALDNQEGGQDSNGSLPSCSGSSPTQQQQNSVKEEQGPLVESEQHSASVPEEEQQNAPLYPNAIVQNLPIQGD
jgi:hypothetical protein